MQRACVGAVLEELQPLGRAHAGAVHKGLQLQGETHSEKGETCEEERVAETSCYKQCNPHSPPAMPLRRGGRGVRGEAELGRKGRLGECPLCFSVSHCFSSSITWQSVVNFPLVELFLPMRVIGK